MVKKAIIISIILTLSLKSAGRVYLLRPKAGRDALRPMSAKLHLRGIEDDYRQELDPAYVSSMHKLLYEKRGLRGDIQWLISHIETTSYIALSIAKRLNVPEEDTEKIAIAVNFHDIGKLHSKRLWDRVFTASRRFDPKNDMDVFREISKHPAYSIYACNELGLALDADVRVLMSNHHLPERIGDSRLRLLCEIISIADIADAVTNNRPYEPRRQSHTMEKALDIIESCWQERFEEGYFSHKEIYEAFLDFASNDKRWKARFEANKKSSNHNSPDSTKSSGAGLPWAESLFDENSMHVYSDKTFEKLTQTARKNGAVYVTALAGAGKTSWMLKMQKEAKVSLCNIYREDSDEELIMHYIAYSIGIDSKEYNNPDEFCESLKHHLGNRILVLEDIFIWEHAASGLFTKIVEEFNIPVIFIDPAQVRNSYYEKGKLQNNTHKWLKNCCRNTDIPHIRLSPAQSEDFRKLIPELITLQKEDFTDAGMLSDADIDWNRLFDKLLDSPDLAHTFYEISGGHLSSAKGILMDILFLYEKSVELGKDKTEDSKAQFSGISEVIDTAEDMLTLLRDPATISGPTLEVILDFTLCSNYDSSITHELVSVFSRFRQQVPIKEILGWSGKEQAIVKEFLDYGLLREDSGHIRYRNMLAELCNLERYAKTRCAGKINIAEREVIEILSAA